MQSTTLQCRAPLQSTEDVQVAYFIGKTQCQLDRFVDEELCNSVPSLVDQGGIEQCCSRTLTDLADC